MSKTKAECMADIELVNEGLTLRDYFAAKAMNSIMDGSWPDFQLSPKSQLSPLENCAYFAYQMADAMMEARK